MSASNKRVVIELEKGPQDEGWQLDDGTNFLAYRQQPLGEGQLSEVADLVTYFIDHAEQLFEPGTTGEEDDVQHELAKYRADALGSWPRPKVWARCYLAGLSTTIRPWRRN